MKKHPVDKLFADKLKDSEIKPRPEAWEKLQHRMQTKQRRIGWWQQARWQAAAGITLLLLAGWLTWNYNVPTETQVAIKSPASQTNKPTNDRSLSETSQSPITSAPENATQGAVSAGDQKESSVHNGKENVQPASVPALTQPMVAQHTEQPEQKAVIATEPTPVSESEESQVAQVMPKSEEKTAAKKVVLQLPDLAETLVAVNAPASDRESSELGINSLDDENAVLRKPHKSTRMAKVWQQLKNAKNGERVDWDEVGFNPNKLLAKATGKER